MSKIYMLSAVEVETLRRAAVDRDLPFDSERTEYSEQDLKQYGLVREGYTRDELREIGITPSIVTSFDENATETSSRLTLETPFGSGIQKWQLPIDMMPIRVAKTIFPPKTRVDSHVHPEDTASDPGGGLRMVATGSVIFKNNKYLPGDWFFVPNGAPYEFVTDEVIPTTVFYTYRFFGAVEGNRFSHPRGCGQW